MNRLECLQTYPIQYRKIFYFAAPTVFIFFALSLLMGCFGFSFQEAQTYWYIPAFIGGAFTLYASQNILFSEEEQKMSRTKRDIEADPLLLKEELERSNRLIMPVIKGLVSVLALLLLLQSPFSRELAQVADLIALCCFLAAGAYFRQVLHIYVRTPGISNEETNERLAQRGLFQIYGWATIGFFFLKTLGLKGKMGNFWSGFPNLQLPIFLLILALTVYLVGIIGILLEIFTKKRTERALNGIFNACIAFGSTFPIVWLYFYMHPFLFVDIPAWLIQLPGLLLVVVNSLGIYFSFQPSLQEKIWGNSCLWFVKYGEQVLIYIFFWAAAVLYADMDPKIAAINYGAVFAFMSLSGVKRPTLAIIAIAVMAAPFLFKSEELPAKIMARKICAGKVYQIKENSSSLEVADSKVALETEGIIRL